MCDRLSERDVVGYQIACYAIKHYNTVYLVLN